MLVEFLLPIMAIGMIALAAYFIGYDKGKKDAKVEDKEEHYLTD